MDVTLGHMRIASRPAWRKVSQKSLNSFFFSSTEKLESYKRRNSTREVLGSSLCEFIPNKANPFRVLVGKMRIKRQ